uniref:Putative single-stranded DNA-binding protein n=1 Tax=viral metagenome TaxID=1070528 RepID=A0A6M3II69_9ZZZZ
MTINDLDKFIASLPDWAILNGCFGDTKIRPTDIDGMVERNGKCLFLEHKGRRASLSKAQARAFRSLAEQGNTVITFWSEGEDVQRFRVDYRGGFKMFDPATLDDLRDIVSRWFSSVNSP